MSDTQMMFSGLAGCVRSGQSFAQALDRSFGVALFFSVKQENFLEKRVELVTVESPSEMSY